MTATTQKCSGIRSTHTEASKKSIATIRYPPRNKSNHPQLMRQYMLVDETIYAVSREAPLYHTLTWISSLSSWATPTYRTALSANETQGNWGILTTTNGGNVSAPGARRASFVTRALPVDCCR